MDWPVSDDILETMKKFDVLVRAGRMKSIAIVGVQRDGTISSAYVTGGDVFPLMGGAYYLLQRISSTIG